MRIHKSEEVKHKYRGADANRNKEVEGKYDSDKSLCILLSEGLDLSDIKK